MKDKICKRCVMDTTDPEIVFDKNGKTEIPVIDSLLIDSLL